MAQHGELPGPCRVGTDSQRRGPARHEGTRGHCRAMPAQALHTPPIAGDGRIDAVWVAWRLLLPLTCDAPVRNRHPHTSFPIALVRLSPPLPCHMVFHDTTSVFSQPILYFRHQSTVSPPSSPRLTETTSTPPSSPRGAILQSLSAGASPHLPLPSPTHSRSPSPQRCPHGEPPVLPQAPSAGLP